MIESLTAGSVNLTSAPTVTCEICLTRQTAPGRDAAAWRCRLCGQDHRIADGMTSIVLSERQLAALRTQGGRDASGRSTLMPNWWTDNNEPTGAEFLTQNKDTPARRFTRKLITDLAASRQIQSILEIAFGGLHEFRALRQPLSQHNVTYRGIDWTAHFVAHAQKEFPQNSWLQGDIVRGVTADPADLVYSQHMLEHLPALEPAFSNMLRLAGKTLINIFFIPPKSFPGYEVTNWSNYPLYHNTYSSGHVEKICQANGFTCEWTPFPPNPQGQGAGQDVVLIATRK